MKRISFDFDETLEFKEVQDYAKELLERGYEIWIVTTRYENPDEYSFHMTHNDLYEAAKYIGIKKEHIHFNNMEYKYSFFKDNTFIFHLDDNPDEHKMMLHNTNTPCILYGYSEWKERCEKLLV